MQSNKLKVEKKYNLNDVKNLKSFNFYFYNILKENELSFIILTE